MAITKATASSIAPAAKGDLVVGSATNDAGVLAVGTNTHILVADSTETLGMKWAAASSGALTKIISQQITNSAGYNLDSIFTSTYTNYFITITDCSGSGSADLRIQLRYGSSTQVNTHYKYAGLEWGSGSTVTGSENTRDFIIATDDISESNITFYISEIGNASEKPYFQLFCRNLTTGTSVANIGHVNDNQTYTGLRFTASTGNVTALVTVYGYQE